MPRRRTAQTAEIQPKKLLDAADALVEHHIGQGRPRQSYLRRAVSTAYYAVFHQFTLETSRHLLPQGSVTDRLALRRSVDHGAIRKVCDWIANPNGSPEHVRPMVTSLAQDNSVVTVALSFLDLLEARHRADYDHLNGFSKPAALQHLATAKATVRDLERLSAPNKDRLLALIAMQVRKVE